jgi:exosortase/archaeosortase family protein
MLRFHVNDLPLRSIRVCSRRFPWILGPLLIVKRLFSQLPKNFAWALVLAAGFMAFVIRDQWHWWNVKEDYSFGFLVPLFVGYVVFDRWPQILKLLGAAQESSPPRFWGKLMEAAALVGLLGGTMAFMLGGFVQVGGIGASPTGSFAIAFGFGAVLLSLVYLSAPSAKQAPASGSGLRAALADPRFQLAALFLFPAAIWLISAPLLTALENRLSLFLLNKVTGVVFFSFDMLGMPLERQGNVLVLPKGSVGVAEACSGIRSLTACLFAGSFLAATFLNKFWKKSLLIGMALVLAFITNIMRSLFLTGWAYAYGSDAIEGTIHDVTGYAVLGLTSIGLICLLPILNFSFAKSPDADAAKTEGSQQAEPEVEPAGKR